MSESNNLITLYAQDGRAVAYIKDGKDIYLYGGKPAAYIHGDSVYGYSGAHLGRMNNGWIRDNEGHCAFFVEGNVGSGPVRPVRQIRPIRGVRGVRPVRSVRQVRPVKPVNRLSWSPRSDEAFFAT